MKTLRFFPPRTAVAKYRTFAEERGFVIQSCCTARTLGQQTLRLPLITIEGDTMKARTDFFAAHSGCTDQLQPV